MPLMGNWLSQTKLKIETSTRSQAAWQRIQDAPVSLIIRRGGTSLAAQTVRVELDAGALDVTGAGAASKRGAIIFGVRGHASVANTDLAIGDRFLLDGKTYEIRDVLSVAWEMQANAERIS